MKTQLKKRKKKEKEKTTFKNLPNAHFIYLISKGAFQQTGTYSELYCIMRKGKDKHFSN